MKTKVTLAFILGAAAAAVAVYLIREKKSANMLNAISSEGYETAGDMLFPGKSTGGKLHYGPVLPS